MLNLKHFLVDGWVRCRQSVEGAPKSQRAPRSGGRCPSVSEKARSGTAADAHGVSISLEARGHYQERVSPCGEPLVSQITAFCVQAILGEL